MRKMVAVLIAAVLGAGLPAAAVQLTASQTERAAAPKVAPALERQLAAGGGPDAAAEPLVVFVHGRDLSAARSAVGAAGLDRLGEWASIDVVVAGGTAAQVAAVIRQPGVTYVEPNTPISFSLDTARVSTRTAEAQAREWPVTTTTTETPTSRKCAPKGNRPTKKGCEPRTVTSSRNVGPFDGAGRSIAIVDSGIDGTHPMFQRDDGTSTVVRNMKLLCLNNTPVYFPDLAGQGQFPPDTCPADPAAQDQLWVDFTDTYNDTDTPSAGGHGTHVAAIAGGRPVTAMGRDLAGTAPGSSLIGLSIGGSLGIYGANTALDWISRHHDAPCGEGVPAADCPPITVVNNSYGTVGGGEFDPESATAKLQRALVAEGVVMVWANGNGDELNDGGNGSDNRSNPPGQDPTPGIISVANYDDFETGTREGGLNSSSSRGERGRVETYPDVSAPGTNITAACRPYLSICTSFEEDPNYGTIGGTSMAAPHVAGIVATLQEAMEEAGQSPTPAAIEDLLEDTAHKFVFGGDYEADLAENNADDTTSFDKGHGLVDTYNALSEIFGLAPSEPGGGSGPECTAGTTGFSDEEGDATTVALIDVEPAYDPRVDLVGVTIEGDPTAETIGFTFAMAEVDGSDPSGAPGLAAELTFAVGGGTHEVNVSRSASGGSTAGSVDGTDATVVVDEEADTLEVTAPRTALGDVHGTITLSGLHSYTRRDSGVVLAPVADEAGGPCPVTVDVGGAPAPPVEPEAGTYEAKVERGGTHAWEGTPPVPTNVAPTADTQCNLPDDPRCDHESLWLSFDGGSAKLSLTVEFPEGDDFDIHLYGPDGALVNSAATAENPEVLTATLNQPGVYRVSVASFFSPGDSYSASLSLT